MYIYFKSIIIKQFSTYFKIVFDVTVNIEGVEAQ
jgi:hypothetical protein